MSRFLEELRKRQQAQAEVQDAQSDSDSPAVPSTPAQSEAPASAAAPPFRQFRIGSKPADSSTASQVPAAPEPGSVDADEHAAERLDDPRLADKMGEGPAGPADFQTTLNRFDSLCQSAAGIEPMTMANARRFIEEIMGELRANPSAADLLIDRDIHNIMTFINATNATAMENVEVKQVKRVKAASKAAVANSTIDAFKAAFFQLTSEPQAASPATNLTAFATTAVSDKEE